MVLLRQKALHKVSEAHRFLNLNLKVQGGMILVLPTFLKCTSFWTIGAMGIFWTPLTQGIIQYIIFPSEIHVQRPHVKYTLPGAFSHISAIDFVLIDIWLHCAIQNQYKFKENSIFNFYLCESKCLHLGVTEKVPTPKWLEGQGSFQRDW